MIALLLAWLLAAAHAAPEALLERANSAYLEGDYAASAETFEALISAGHESGDLYYNLGNARYREGETGRAILAWRRAILLSPRDGDAEANLARARRETTDRLDAAGASPAFRPFFWEDSLSLSEQGWSAALLLGIFFSLFAARRLRPGLSVGIPALACGVGGGLLAASAWWGLRALSVSPGAVVLAERVEVRSAAGSASGVVVFALHEGAEVTARDQLGGYTQIALPDGRRGWMEAGALGVVDPRLPMP